MTGPGTRGQFVRFAGIGVVAFAIDASVLLFARDTLDLGLYAGRVVSFLVAVTTTWALNRRFTFPDASRAPMLGQWARFVAANSLGAAANYGTYAALVTFVPTVAQWPVLGVAAGSLAGLGLNFVSSKAFVFSADPAHARYKGDD